MVVVETNQRVMKDSSFMYFLVVFKPKILPELPEPASGTETLSSTDVENETFNQGESE